jgi:hypothetical protein
VILRFGKYAHWPLGKVPGEYVSWLAESCEETARECRAELERRALQEDAEMPWIERLVKTGYRELAKRHHPDCGGGTAEMREVNAAFEALQAFLRDGSLVSRS